MKLNFSFLLGMLLLLMAGCLKEIEDRIPPKPFANFSFTNDGCIFPCAIQFTNSSQNANAYSWNFGDGSVSTDVNPSKTYTQKGQYVVKLRATSSVGVDDTTMVVTIRGQGPEVAFEIINDNCVVPCSPSFKNTSQNATNYEWTFGDGKTSTQFSPSNLYNTKGKYTVKLKAFNTHGVDSLSKIVTIKSTNFQSVLNVSTDNTTPLHVVELSDGRYHVLYKDDEYRSVLVERGGVLNTSSKVTFTALNHFADALAIPTSDGGFTIAGNNSNPFNSEIQYARISSSRSATPLFNKSLKFLNADESKLYGLILDNNGNLCITGQAKSLGLPRKSSIGLIIANNLNGNPSSYTGAPLINTDIQGVHLVQNSNGTYTILAREYDFVNGDPHIYKEYLVSFNGGSFSLTSTLGFNVYYGSKILQSGANYLIINLENNLSSVVVSDNVGKVKVRKDFTQTLQNAILDRDGNLIISGIVKGSGSKTSLYLAKLDSLTGNPIWEKTFTDPSASISGEFISLSADGGYLVLGKYSLNGATDLFLVKTDTNGNIE